jgi:uncharacterized sulfatase
MGNFRSFLEARPEGKPFCYWFGPTNVHRKWTRGSGKDLWGLDPDALEGRMPKFLPDVDAVREDLGEVTNLYSRAVYKKQLARVLVKRALEQLREA